MLKQFIHCHASKAALPLAVPVPRLPFGLFKGQTIRIWPLFETVCQNENNLFAIFWPFWNVEKKYILKPVLEKSEQNLQYYFMKF